MQSPILPGKPCAWGLILIMAIRMNRDVGAVDEIRLFHRLSVCSIAQIVFEMLWMFSWSLMPGMPRAVLYLCCLSDLVCTGFIVFFLVPLCRYAADPAPSSREADPSYQVPSVFTGPSHDRP